MQWTLALDRSFDALLSLSLALDMLKTSISRFASEDTASMLRSAILVKGVCPTASSCRFVIPFNSDRLSILLAPMSIR